MPQLSSAAQEADRGRRRPRGVPPPPEHLLPVGFLEREASDGVPKLKDLGGLSDADDAATPVRHGDSSAAPA